MAEVEFNFNGKNTIIQCYRNEKIGDIIKKFGIKSQRDTNDLFYIYNGNSINYKLDSTFEEIANSNDKERNKIKILVNGYIPEPGPHYLIKSKEIICPTCGENILISFKNYKISLLDCKNGHIIEDLSFNDFESKQEIDESKIECEECKDNNKSKIYKNLFYRCNTCKKNICPLCKLKHDKSHYIIDYDSKNYNCDIHNEIFVSYCKSCKRNICGLCGNNHENHEVNKYMEYEKNDKINEINNLRNKIEEMKKDINSIIYKLNNVINYIEEYYKVFNTYVNDYHYDIKKRNYESLKNINEILNNEIIHDVSSVVKENNIYNKFKKLIVINNKIEGNATNESEEENNDSDDEISINYYIYKNEENIRIFGSNFVKNNQKICKIVYDNKEYDLQESLNLKEFKLKDNMLKIKLKNINDITNMSYMFCDCEFLASIPNISKMNTINVTDMSYMFSGCQSLLTLPEISKFNTSNVTKMNNMFSYCKSLKSLPDISKWDTKNVTDISHFFYNCQSLSSIPNISKWQTYYITNMSYMFSYCEALLSLPDISKWNTVNVNNMSYMFSYCKSVVTLPDISNWDTYSTTNMSYLFSYCESLLYLPDISKWNTLNVNNMCGMFSYCKSLGYLPDIFKWGTINVKNMSYMFSHCESLLSLPNISSWDTSNVTDMRCMFSYCKSLTYIPEDLSNWDLSKVRDYANMFDGCDKSLKIPSKLKNCIIF